MYYNLNDFFLDPIALKVGPIVVRWYALAYIAGLFLGWRYCALLLKRGPFVMELQQLEDLIKAKEQQVKDLKATAENISGEVIPTMMTEMNIKTLKLADLSLIHI